LFVVGVTLGSFRGNLVRCCLLGFVSVCVRFGGSFLGWCFSSMVVLIQFGRVFSCGYAIRMCR